MKQPAQDERFNQYSRVIRKLLLAEDLVEIIDSAVIRKGCASGETNSMKSIVFFIIQDFGIAKRSSYCLRIKKKNMSMEGPYKTRREAMQNVLSLTDTDSLISLSEYFTYDFF